MIIIKEFLASRGACSVWRIASAFNENTMATFEPCIMIGSEVGKWKKDQILGFAPVEKATCSSEQSQKIYDDINMNLVKENIALKDILSAREREIVNLKALPDRAKRELK